MFTEKELIMIKNLIKKLNDLEHKMPIDELKQNVIRHLLSNNKNDESDNKILVKG